jgi:hypothetical protein
MRKVSHKRADLHGTEKQRARCTKKHQAHCYTPQSLFCKPAPSGPFRSPEIPEDFPDYSVGELAPDVAAIAVPILAEDHLLGAVTVAGPAGTAPSLGATSCSETQGCG